jgi:hypothetical protein
MTRIPSNDRDVLEQAMYLPMVMTVFERDRIVFEKSPFKLKQPYLNLLEESIKVVQRDLKTARDYMRKNKMKVEEINRDDTFTMFMFLYKGYEEQHNYFNPRIRNKVQELLEYYLYKRFE